MTPKQQRFVDEFFIDCNATQAAVRAGYSAKAANREGSRLLSKVDIQTAISTRAKELHEKTGLTQERVLNELMAVGFSDLSEYVTWGSGGMLLKSDDELTSEQRHCVEGFQVVGRNIVPKLYDKLKAPRAFGEHLKLFKPEEQGVTQNFLHLHLGPEDEEPAEKPTQIEGLKLHLGE